MCTILTCFFFFKAKLFTIHKYILCILVIQKVKCEKCDCITTFSYYYCQLTFFPRFVYDFYFFVLFLLLVWFFIANIPIFFFENLNKRDYIETTFLKLYLVYVFFTIFDGNKIFPKITYTFVKNRWGTPQQGRMVNMGSSGENPGRRCCFAPLFRIFERNLW